MKKFITANIIYIGLFMMYFSNVYSQEGTGAVCISEKGNEPHPSAMLQINSNKKGVLFPRMTFEAATKIENKKDGLIVFVTDSLKLGYWYWNGKEAKWIQLRSEGTSNQDIEAPPGGIIMYSGKIEGLFNSSGKGIKGTKMEGWQICNGQNNSPDLTGRFIMASTTRKQEYGGTDSLKLTLQNIPAHSHETNEVKGTIQEHSHSITEQRHTHSITVVWKKIMGLKRKERIEVRKSGGKHVVNLPESTDIGGDGKIIMKETPGILTFSTRDLNSQINIQNAGGGKALENRPSFYVLIYLMRINTEE